MTLNITEPEEMLTEFLRAELTEPTRVGISARHTNTTETQTANGTASQFTVTNTKLLCINNFTANSVVMKKYQDYDVDLRNNRITFAIPPSAGSSNIIIDYDYNTAGTSWIYPDMPRVDLGRTSYPRIGVLLISEGGDPMGLFDNSYWNTIRFQIDVITMKELTLTSDSETIEGAPVTDSIARDVVEVIKNQWRSKLTGQLYYPVFLNNAPMPYDEQHALFRRMIEVQFNAEDIGT
jgi:hypothetical protein